MKKIAISVIIGGILLIPFTVQAGVCDPVIDKNNRCDVDGEYHDPSFEQINKGNCSKYKTKINEYCSMSCREDAHTYFPNNVPYLSLDQYDSILGGNHFRWEEIKTDSKIQCKTTVEYDKWLNDFKEVTQKREYTPTEGVIHTLMEMHQRYTDVTACDLWDYVDNKGSLSGYPWVTQNYWKSVGKSTIRNILVSNRITRDNCDGCAGSVSVEKAIGFSQISLRPEVKDIATAKKQKAKELKEKYKSNQSVEEISKVIASVKALWSNGSNAADKIYTTALQWCVGAKNTDGSRTIYKPFDKNCADKIITNKSGNYRIYNKIEGVDLGNTFTLKSYGYKQYCPEKGEKPYNSDGWDIYWDEASNSSQLGTGNSAYMQSVSKMQNDIKDLLGKIKRCTTKSDEIATKSNTTSIVVNYKDPMNVYSRNIKLNKNEISSDSDRKVQEAAEAFSGLTWNSCNDITIDELKKKFEESLKTGKLVNINCKTELLTSHNAYLNRSITYTQNASYKYTMPENTYNYILKTSGESVDSTNKSKVTAEVIKNNRYINIGYPNYPVHFSTPTGTYDISLTYENIGWEGHLVKKAKYVCEYKVINRVVCKNPPCETPTPTPTTTLTPPVTITPGGPGGPNTPGINVIYRPISLTNPFPGENATNMVVTKTGRAAGANWTQEDIKEYITNNRKVTQNEVYSKTPLYSFTLDTAAIRKIRNYNKGKDYNDFNLRCSNAKNGKRCISDFLKDIKNLGVTVNKNTCWNKGQANFYTCADKPNQDNIKCYAAKGSGKLTCVDCSNAENKKKYAVCK